MILIHADVFPLPGPRRPLPSAADAWGPRPSTGRGKPKSASRQPLVLPHHRRRHACDRQFRKSGPRQDADQRSRSWDGAEPQLRPRDPERWRIIDKAIDGALAQLRAVKPQSLAAKDALQNLLASLDRQRATVAPATAESARLSVTDIIAAAEKLQVGASVLDVSFEPKDGQPVYAIRTYANGKVWDGLLDGASGAAIDQGTVMDESALDAEDKAELAALKGAKITLRQAIASAEKLNGGRALNAGLEQIHGRAVWEILIQNTTQPQQIHIDPISGKIL
jgi:uncharacterized membrane protein YkoI